MSATTGRARARRTGVLAVPLALLASGALVYQASHASFTASTRTGENSWDAGTVSLDADAAGSVVFAAEQLTPGAFDQRCIEVTYTGTLPSLVRFYARSASGTLAPFIDVEIQEGTGSGASDCSGFVADATLSSAGDTLADFVAGHSDFTSGVSDWTPTGPGQVRTYRLSWVIGGGNAAQGREATAQLVWEARNT